MRSAVPINPPTLPLNTHAAHRYLASGSFDKNIYVWSVADGSLIRTCKGEAGIYEVSWNAAGDRVAACYACRTVCVVDLRL